MVISLIPNEVKEILNLMEQNGFEAYLVGGFVRDFLMFRNTNDFDIATNALPKNIQDIFGSMINSCQYGSCNLKVGAFNIDITTYRKELSYTNRYPTKMEYTSNLILDAKRRDFTMNAIYMNKNGEIIDPLNSQKDICKKNLKMIGNPMIRLKEDPLRILRAVRFASQYHLKIEKNLKKAIQKEKKNLKQLSKNRIKSELDKILLANGFPLLKKLDLLQELGIQTEKIVYVEDLAGLWAQIETDIDYPKEKNIKIREKNIKEQIKCGTMNMLWLYENGFYDAKVVSKIIHFSLKKLEKMDKSLQIHSRNEIAICNEDIMKVSKKTGKELGNLIDLIETNIVLGKIENTKESILKFIEER